MGTKTLVKQDCDRAVADLIPDCSAVLSADLTKGTVRLVSSRRLSDIISADIFGADGKYKSFFESYVNKYLDSADHEIYKQILSSKNIRDRLGENTSYTVTCRRICDGQLRPIEICFADVSEERDASRCIITFRYADKEPMTNPRKEMLDGSAETVSEQRLRLEAERANAELKKALDKEIVYRKELKSALETAELATRAKAEFLSRMSHDIRTPMNAIIGMTAIAGAHLDDSERIKDCLTKITASSRHLLTIINDILDMSKIESGKFNIKQESFRLSELIYEVLDLTGPQIKAKKHNFRIQIHDVEHEDVVGDRTRLQQALLNILSNAVKYTPDGGKISMSVSERKTRKPKTGCYEFIVEDNGIGMSEEVANRLFDPFNRGEDLRINAIQGTGLGMSLTQNIIHMMGGIVDVESAPAKGSKFTVVITLKLAETAPENALDTEGMKVLIADSDADSNGEVCALLDSFNAKGEEALSAAELFDKLAGGGYGAVMLDWGLPDVYGADTIKKIHDAAGEDIPVIVISSDNADEIKPIAKEAGAAAFINKPVFKSRLTSTFRQLFARKGAEPFSHGLEVLQEQDFSGKRILIVEDNDLNREIGRELVETAGAEVEEAIDGREAIDMVASSPDGYYDLILMDIQMPVMNGYEATKAIRGMDKPYCKTLPILAMTANSLNEDIQMSFSTGMNGHISKPIDLKQLSELMKQWLERS